MDERDDIPQINEEVKPLGVSPSVTAPGWGTRRFLRAAQGHRRLLIRVVSEVLLRTGLRVGELIALRVDAAVLIGDGHWLHVPVGKLHDDRYLPLHPQLVTLIGEYRAAQRDDAANKGQVGREKIFNGLLERLDHATA